MRPPLTILAIATLTAGPALADSGHHHATPAGRAGDPKRVARTIEIRMTDQMRFEPAEIRVRRNETVRLTVANVGEMRHELVIGTRRELEKHAEEMKKHPEMEHDEPNQIALDGGRRGDIVWRFTRTGTFRYGCLLPGHFDQGMIGRIVVSP